MDKNLVKLAALIGRYRHCLDEERLVAVCALTVELIQQQS